jgi:hypothetical protein
MVGAIQLLALVEERPVCDSQIFNGWKQPSLLT